MCIECLCIMCLCSFSVTQCFLIWVMCVMSFFSDRMGWWCETNVWRWSHGHSQPSIYRRRVHPNDVLAGQGHGKHTSTWVGASTALMVVNCTLNIGWYHIDNISDQTTKLILMFFSRLYERCCGWWTMFLNIPILGLCPWFMEISSSDR